MSEVGRHSLLTTEWSGWLSLCMKCGGTVSSLHCEAAGCLYAWSVETQSPHYRVKRLDVYALSMETQSPHNSVKRLAVPLHELWRHSLLTTEWSGWLYLCMKCEDTVSSVKSEAAGCLYAWSVETQSPHNSVKRLAVPLHEVWRHSLLTTEWSRWLSLCMKCGGSVETQSPHYRVNRLAVPMHEVWRRSLLTTEWSGWLSLCTKCEDTVSSLQSEPAGCPYAWSVKTQSPHYRVKRLAVSMHEVWRYSLLTTAWSGWLYLCVKCGDTVSSLQSEAAGCLYAWSMEVQSPHYSVKRLAVSMHEVWRYSPLTTAWSGWLYLCVKCGDPVSSLQCEAAGCL